MNKEKTYQINSPLKIEFKRKVFSLNLNIYRNFNRFALGEAKKAYEAYMQPQLRVLPNMQKIELKYILFTGSKRKVDIMNIMSIVDKFFCDCLTSGNIIPDDNYENISKVFFEFGGIDKENPRVEIYIKDVS